MSHEPAAVHEQLTSTPSSAAKTVHKPTFLVIGAMKSATTSLHQYLASHPDICMSRIKEPGFFVEELNWSRGWQWYSDLFNENSGATAVGESSTYYTKFPLHRRVPERIAQYLPDVRFIYVMREPIARAVSHYWWVANTETHFWWAANAESESRSLNSALSGENIYVDVSRYAMQLEQYLQYFPLERFYFTTYERLTTNPNQVLRDCFTFLGVDPRHSCNQAGQVFNPTPKAGKQLRGWLHRIRWSPWWSRMAPYIPRRLKAVGKRFERKPMNRNQEMTSSLRRRLEDFFANENERLFRLIGQRFDEWGVRESGK